MFAEPILQSLQLFLKIVSVGSSGIRKAYDAPATARNRIKPSKSLDVNGGPGPDLRGPAGGGLWALCRESIGRPASRGAPIERLTQRRAGGFPMDPPERTRGVWEGFSYGS